MRISVPVGASLIQELVARNAPHANHDKMVELALFWRSIVSGKGQDEIVVSYKARETKEQKTQRMKLYVTPTPESAERGIANFTRLESADPPTRDIKYQGDNTLESDQEKILRGMLKRFNGERDLDRYLLDTMKRYIQVDTNAFLVVLFNGERDENGFFKEKPRPKPEIVEAPQVYDFLKENGDYKWLCRLQHFQNEIEPKGGKWQKYTLYTPDYVFEAFEISEGHPLSSVPYGDMGETFTVKRNQKDVLFVLVSLPISSAGQIERGDSEVPFMPLGYQQSMEGEWNDTIFTCAESRFRDLINRKSEYLLTMALHVFLQKMQYVQKCKYNGGAKGRCQDGRLSLKGEECPSCKGTGENVIATVQDTITITLPDNREEFFPLSELAKYVDMPFEIVNHLKAEIEDIENKIEAAIWGINLREKPTGTMTATEILSKYDTANVKLSRIDQHIGMMWEKCVRLTAKYAEIEKGLSCSYSPRRNYQLETLGELMAAFSEAKTSGAPYAVIRGLELAILKKQGKTTDEQIQWNEAMEGFRPFRTKTETDRAMVLSTLPDDDYFKVLWSFYDEIFEEIKNETPLFFVLKYVEQKSVVSAKVAEYQKTIREQSPIAQPSANALNPQNGVN